MKKRKFASYPPAEAIEKEIKRVETRKGGRALIRHSLFILLTFAAIAVLVTLLWLPLLRIYGSSMDPTLLDGEIVVAVKTTDFSVGDIIAFRYNDKVLVKRVIARAGEWVMVDDSGKVYINDRLIDEPYVDHPALGDCNIDMPYQVPESRIFVMGDHRSVSLDSRNTAVGCVANEQIIGRLAFRIWPLSAFGRVE